MTGQQLAVTDDVVSRIQCVPVPGWGPLDGDGEVAVPPSCATGSRSPAREQTPEPGWTRPPGDQDRSQPGADWPHAFARLLVEALAGTRPARQILPWTTARARSQFDRLLRAFDGAGAAGAGKPGTGKSGAQARVVRVVATQPTAGVIEMSVIAGFGARTRAFALRLERPAGKALTPLGKAPASGASTHRPPWPDAVLAASSGWVCTDIEGAS